MSESNRLKICSLEGSPAADGASTAAPTSVAVPPREQPEDPLVSAVRALQSAAKLTTELASSARTLAEREVTGAAQLEARLGAFGEGLTAAVRAHGQALRPRARAHTMAANVPQSNDAQAPRMLPEGEDEEKEDI
ncbi:hypothetical protein T492DRAFT_856821, partial [Pavlovales sp. CCMP2436]